MSRPPDPRARLDLLRAAEAVFIERGLDAAKVEEITARAGRSKGSFYLHFDSKEEAFQQIVVGMLARIADMLDEGIRRTRALADDPRAQQEAWLDVDVRLFEYVWENRGVMRLVLAGGGRLGYMIDQFAEQARRLTLEALREGARRGQYRDLDVELVSLAVAGAYDAVARELVRRDRKPDLRAWLSEMQRLTQRGILAPHVQAMIDRPVTNGRRNGSGKPGIPRAASRAPRTRRR